MKPYFKDFPTRRVGVVLSKDITLGEIEWYMELGAKIELGYSGSELLYIEFDKEFDKPMTKKERNYERSKAAALEKDQQPQIDYEKSLDL